MPEKHFENQPRTRGRANAQPTEAAQTRKHTCYESMDSRVKSVCPKCGFWFCGECLRCGNCGYAWTAEIEAASTTAATETLIDKPPAPDEDHEDHGEFYDDPANVGPNADPGWAS
jgi:hypothetical protein